jgi:hypothetical protein
MMLQVVALPTIIILLTLEAPMIIILITLESIYSTGITYKHHLRSSKYFYSTVACIINTLQSQMMMLELSE